MRGLVNRSVALALAVLVTGAVSGPGLAAARVARAGATRAGAPARPATTTPAAPSPAWLAEINRYRTATGLPPVSDNPAWDAGLRAHLRYLAQTPRAYFTGAYQSLHTENPASPYYTPAGATEARSSDLAFGGVSSAVAAVDGWWAAPFHAVGMLRAGLTEVALAADPRTGYAGLDVIQGLNPLAPADPNPILFPGPGASTGLLTFSGGELPSPLETCGWTHASPPFGLPLVLLAPQTPAAGLTATLRGPGGTQSSAAHSLCVVDARTYHSSDPVYGPTGLEILQGDNAVFLIPRHPLRPGSYAVTVTQPGRADIAWSFTATGAPVPTLRTRIAQIIVSARSVRAVIATPPGTALRCALSRWLGHRFANARFVACGRGVVYHSLRHGRYRLDVRSRRGDAARVFTVG